jgi:DNA-binding NarL/FixJ family response regulator
VIRIIIVEDDPVTLGRIEQSLIGLEDMNVIGTASNVGQSQPLIAAGGYDVLLCDLGLPDGSGIDVIRASSMANPEADIIVITVFAEQAKVLNSIKAGAHGYLLKDENLDGCAERIREVRAGGSPISPLIARQLLRQLAPAPASDGPEIALTPRETEVLNMLARGFSYNEIADILHLSAQTIATHVKNLYRKLEVRSRSEAVFEASSRGIISLY